MSLRMTITTFCGDEYYQQFLGPFHWIEFISPTEIRVTEFDKFHELVDRIIPIDLKSQIAQIYYE